MVSEAILAQSLLSINSFVTVVMTEIWKLTFGYVWIFSLNSEWTKKKKLEALMLFLSSCVREESI